jgi:hypothetical protein
MPPSVFNGGATSTGTIFWSASDIGSARNLTLDIVDSGFSWNPRFDTNAVVTEPSVPTPWSADWICVEWKNENTQVAPFTYAGSVTITRPGDTLPQNGGTIMSTGTAMGVQATFGALVFGPDLDLRIGTGPTTFTQWFDEIIIDDKPIGCTRRR